MKKLYKALNSYLKIPYQDFQIEVGKNYNCEDFDEDPKNDCSRGFYAKDLIDGLSYAYHKEKVIFQWEVRE
jgi:hypothetical protein